MRRLTQTKIIGITASLGNFFAVSSLVNISNLVALLFFFRKGRTPKPLLPVYILLACFISYIMLCAIVGVILGVQINLVELRAWLIWFGLVCLFSSIFFYLDDFKKLVETALWTLSIIGILDFLFLNFASIEIGNFLLRDDFQANNSRMGPLRRLRGPFEEPSVYGYFALSLICIRLSLRDKLSKTLMFAVIISLILTMSAYTYTIGFVVACIYLFCNQKFSEIVLSIASFVLCTVIFLHILPEFFFNTLYQKISFGSAISAVERSAHYNSFVDYFVSLWTSGNVLPIVFGEFSKTFDLRQGTINNSYMYLLIDFGLLGLFMYLGVVGILMLYSKFKNQTFLFLPFIPFLSFGMIAQYCYYPETAILFAFILVASLKPRGNFY